MSAARKELKFAANLSFMFGEHANILERYEAAKQAGFQAVETAFLYDYPLEKVVQAKVNSGLQQVLINAYPGDLKTNDLGLAAIPTRIKEFRDGLQRSIELCKALDCKRLHIMAGRVGSDASNKEMEITYLDNLKHAASELEKAGIVGLIEPINQITIPGYFLNSFDAAIRYLDEIKSQNLKLQLDIFHLQHITGTVTTKIKELMPYVGHIQIAQVPNRHEPDSEGELDCKDIFNLLRELGYDGWIGCEYHPKGNTLEGLKWIKDFGYNLDLTYKQW